MTDDSDDDGPWWTGWMVCRMCGHRQMSVVPTGGNDDVLTRCECANCGNMTAEAEDGSKASLGG